MHLPISPRACRSTATSATTHPLSSQQFATTSWPAVTASSSDSWASRTAWSSLQATGLVSITAHDTSALHLVLLGWGPHFLPVTIPKRRPRRRQACLDLVAAPLRRRLAGDDGLGNLLDAALGLGQARRGGLLRGGVLDLGHGGLGVAEGADDTEAREVAVERAEPAEVEPAQEAAEVLAALDGACVRLLVQTSRFS
jgi:hypothetical protein